MLSPTERQRIFATAMRQHAAQRRRAEDRLIADVLACVADEDAGICAVCLNPDSLPTDTDTCDCCGTKWETVDARVTRRM